MTRAADPTLETPGNRPDDTLEDTLDDTPDDTLNPIPERADGRGGGTQTETLPEFDELGLSPPLLEAVRRAAYHRPTPIQARAIPAVLAGSDLLASAQTGTGKTAAFVLPMLQRLAREPASEGVLRGLVLTPTRELAAQVERAVAAYGRMLPLESVLVHGGVPIRPQVEDLAWGCDVLVATPGRLLDHLGRGTVDLGRVEVAVLDEGDRMLDMGFIDDVRQILRATPRSRQTMLFSATLPLPILSLAHEMMRDPVRIEVGLQAAAEGIREVIHPVDHAEKQALLLHLLESASGQVLVFTRMRSTAAHLASFLRRRDLSVDELHGERSQAERTASLQAFRAGETRILVATNVAARGLDIRGITHVINFDVPEDPNDYVHRVGRTARADEEGDAITLMSPHEWLLVRDIEALTGEPILRSAVPGYEPSVEPLGAVAIQPGADPERPRSRLMRGRRNR